ncbi:hypothetical protein DFQ14_109169 [Halopolyspora algeriensis]|uniref:Uncharacterized protein n=1 Tax=Halopolyspora algeriensis TaxID=1500506 RepID=A0A368VK07_9ACTN|nr:hypothetical protein [Halopolyspora algeriensis]RCW41092.1 hypothetical protein DFQ14_109169 [Halopolyspora algeriensis]TQM53825.1 hypothetical protein FHU43_1994 [Halopolyspora algeriensis]
MSDLVYVSTAKLANLQSSREQMLARGAASGWMSRLTGRVRAAVTVPFVNGELAVESQPPAKRSVLRVRSAIKWLEQRQPPPVEPEDATSADQWIRFHKPVG